MSDYDEAYADEPIDPTLGPQADNAAETAVLACSLASLSARKKARNIISREDFLNPFRQSVWDAMSALDRAKTPVDPYSLNAALAEDRHATAVLPDIISHPSVPSNIDVYATGVRNAAVRFRVWDEARQAQRDALNPNADPTGLASRVAGRFAQVRDAGNAEDVQSVTLGELLAEPDDEPDWVIPGLLERRDRFMLTGGEGLGKSVWLRQVAVMSAAGLHPFERGGTCKPTSVLIVDCENSLRQIKRKARGIVDYARRWGSGNPEQVNLLATGRIDITRDKDLSAIHREVDVIRPDIIVIGPIYAMSPKALMTDDDAVPVLAALDSLRESGAALLMEAHAGHATGQDGRNYRPRGSSALLGWPEFGYGLKPIAKGYADMVPWRGDRDSRQWPERLRYSTDETMRWEEHDGHGFPVETGRIA